jgi:RND family efflux transporter MFP subunit
MTRTSLSLSIAAALSLVSLGACKRGDATPTDTAPTAIVIGTENMTIVTPGTVTDGPTISGSLTAEESATIRAQVSGAVLSTSAEVGDHVKRGQSLGRIDAAGIEDAYQSAKAGVTSAQSALTIAQRNQERSQTLLKAGAIAPRDAETAQQTYISAQAALDDAKSRLAAAEKTLENTRIVAPFAGVVSERSVSAGDVVQPGGALFTVINPSSMRLDVSVPAERIADLRVGTPITFTVGGYPNEQFVGKITRISPAADPATRQVQVLAAIPNTGNRLVAGLFAQGRISSKTQHGLVVPITAIDFRNQTPAVLRLHDGKVARVDVQLGMRDTDAETVLITNGVSAGDTILVGSAQGITPGTPVRVQAPPADRARQ